MTKLTVDTTETKACQKCGKSALISRHHMGYDSYVGHWNLTVYRQYQQFLDCVPLCEDCHMQIHWIYVPYVDAWWQECKPLPTKKQATDLREELISICEQWLKGQINPMPISARFVLRWTQTRQWYQQQVSSGKLPLMSERPEIG